LLEQGGEGVGGVVSHGRRGLARREPAIVDFAAYEANLASSGHERDVS
jgi:hypothetical protein